MKKVVTFRQSAGGYNAGETAGFPPEKADELVSRGVADYFKAVPQQTQTKAGGGDAPLQSAYQTSRAARSSSRGPGRPSKKTSSTTFTEGDSSDTTSEPSS